MDRKKRKEARRAYGKRLQSERLANQAATSKLVQQRPVGVKYAIDPHAPPELVELIASAMKRVPDDLPPRDRHLLNLCWTYGIDMAVECYRAAMEEKFPATRNINHWHEVTVSSFLGKWLYRFCGDALNSFLPWCDVYVAPTNPIFVAIRSLLSQPGEMGTIYYSSRKPTVCIDGRDYIVGYSRHAIERICDRRFPYGWKNFDDMGDVYGIFDQSSWFEPATLRGGRPAFSILLPDEGFLGRYPSDILGSKQAEGFACRFGYCPVSLENGYAKAITLLLAGFRDTPEFMLVSKSRLPHQIRDRFIKAATAHELEITEATPQQSRDLGVPHLRVVSDFFDTEVMKWVHENGIPQVIRRDRAHWSYSVKKTGQLTLEEYRAKRGMSPRTA